MLKTIRATVPDIADQKATGSGIIVAADGFIVTNARVVTNARKVDVSVTRLGSIGQSAKHEHFPATTVGVDQETDLAVLKIEAGDSPALVFMDNSDTLKQGQFVLALGSPLGIDNSLTVGFVSAAVRYLYPEKPNVYIQTDAPINPGNSGYPLLDISGRVAGHKHHDRVGVRR